MDFPIILDQQQTKLAIINEILNPEIIEKINGEYTFSFAAKIQEMKTEYIHYNNIIEVDNNLFQFAKYKKSHIENNKLLISAYCEQISYKLIDEKLDSFIYDNLTAYDALSLALQGTQFYIGSVNVPGTASFNMDQSTNVREVLNTIANAFEGELQFNRYEISLLVQCGQNNGVEFRVGKNVKGISKEVDITKKDAEGNPSVTYEVDLLELNNQEPFKGLEGFRNGDTIKVLDDDLGINVFARIYERTYNPIRKKNTKVVLGNFIEDISTDAITLHRTANLVSARSQVWDRAGVISPQGTIFTELLEGTIDTLQNEVKAGLGTVKVTDNNGIIITDQPTIEASTKAIRLLGGILAISNEKDSNGNFVYRTFGNGDGFTADEIIAGFLASERIAAHSLGADKIKTEELVVGTNVSMGPYAYISWLNVTEKPDIEQMALDKINNTYIDSNGVWTPNVYASNINTLLGKITSAQIETLEVGSNVLMGTEASISWGQVTNQPFIPQNAADIGARPYDWMPEYGQLLGIKPPADADNTYAAIGTQRLTYIDQYGIYTGILTAEQINAIQGINLGVGASIDWAYVAKPNYSAAEVGARPDWWVPTSAQVGAIPSTYIDSNNVFTGNVYANNIYGGILKIADYCLLGSQNAYISSASGPSGPTVEISCDELDCRLAYGVFRGMSVGGNPVLTTESTITAKFA